MKILALETSCDETAVAIVENGRQVLSSVVYSQIDLHAKFGGVIPEKAAREHIATINPAVHEALEQAGMTLEQVDCVAATLGPGLVGSLLIGANTAKTLSMIANKPFRGVNHLYAHVASNYLETDLAPPFLCLLVSGGHTQLVHVKDYDAMEIVGETLDDAVGEAYDKVARRMGLPYPGGPAIDKLAPQGNAKAYPLPIAQTQAAFDFSFSGLKTASLRCYEKAIQTEQRPKEAIQADMAASFQHTVIETLFQKTYRCAQSLGITTLTLAGGVSANRGLRARFEGLAQEQPEYRVFVPSFKYCTDNAAMVGASAYFNPITQDIEQEVFSRALAV